MIHPPATPSFVALLASAGALWLTAACGGEGSAGRMSQSGAGAASSSGAAAGASAAGGATPGVGGIQPNGGSGAVLAGAGMGMTAGGVASGGQNGTNAGAHGGGTPAGGAPTNNSCGSSVQVNDQPFGCSLAWGANGDGGNRSSYLQFITKWVGYEGEGGLDGACDGCKFVQDLAGKSAMPVYYAYFIGYQAAADGFGDCNVDCKPGDTLSSCETFDGQNLCTRGAQWIRANREQLIEMYGSYAQKTYAVSQNRPVAWLLEGDFVQYTYDDQTNKLSWAELEALATDIVCAIKGNAPNALVAMDHSAWLADDVTNDFWDAMPTELMDFIWTTGVGNTGFINPNAESGDYNATTARYSFLHSKTGKGILVDTSFGPSQQADSWSNQTAAILQQRAGEGIIAVNVTSPPSDYQTRIDSLGSIGTCN